MDMGRLRLQYGYGRIRNGARIRFEYGAKVILLEAEI
jgi:hypothetical protein